MTNMIIDANGVMRWYDDSGRLHREKLPAVLYPSGTKCWYRNGLRHREGGPAIEYANGDSCWYFEDLLHRTDGPAIYLKDIDVEYYFKGKSYPEISNDQEWFRLVKLLVLE